jgi:hypothetical protein
MIKKISGPFNLALALCLFAASMFTPLALAQCGTDAAGSTACLQGAIGAANGGNSQIDLGAGFGFGSIQQALSTVISLIFLVAGLAAFVYILLGAFNYLTAGDDSGKTEKARKMITNAVVGLILVALVYVIWLVAINLVPGLSEFFSASNDAGSGSLTPPNPF